MQGVNLYTPKEAAAMECCQPGVGRPVQVRRRPIVDGKTDEQAKTVVVEERKCRSISCMAWVWETPARECLHIPMIDSDEGGKRLAVYERARWSYGEPHSINSYTQKEVSKPAQEGVEWAEVSRDGLGFWTRPAPERRGRCGCITITTMLEVPS